MAKILLLPLFATAAAGCGHSPSAAPVSDCPDDQQAGCPDGALTYDTGIGALLDERCSPCHAAGGVEASTLLLTDYDHARGAQTSIGSQLVTCSMPPAGSPQLSSDERQQILDWLTCGTLR